MKVFISLLSSLLLLTCDGSKSPKINIKTGFKSNVARPGDSLKLSVVTSLERDYQVSYYTIYYLVNYVLKLLHLSKKCRTTNKRRLSILYFR